MYEMDTDPDDDINILDTSIERQIFEAKKRAELYSQTLQESREQEFKALKKLEDERTKWNTEFEKKSILINELERELQSTVETLETEREENYQQHHSNSNLQFSNSLINDFSYPAASQKGNMDRLNNKEHLPSSKSNRLKNSQSISLLSNDEIEKEFQQLLSSSTPSGGLPISSVSPSNRYSITSASLNTQVLGASTNNDNNELSNNIWNELLNQYKEQLTKLKSENLTIFQEKQLLTIKNQELLSSLTSITELKEQYVIALEDCEGKLLFRTKQVHELEEETSTQAELITQLTNEKEKHEKIITSLQDELSLSQSELQEKCE
jgi:hypothetical protein